MKNLFRLAGLALAVSVLFAACEKDPIGGGDDNGDGGSGDEPQVVVPEFPTPVTADVVAGSEYIACCKGKYFLISFERLRDTTKVSTIVTILTSVSCQEYTSIITKHPISIITPDTSEPSDCETELDTFSTSFVIRLIISPCLCVSIYFIGSLDILAKRSLRIILTVYCESFAAKIFWK